MTSEAAGATAPAEDGGGAELGGGDGLTPRQRLVLETVRASVESRGYPPSMREIGDAVGLKSLSSVTHQLGQLELQGYIRRDPSRPRTIEVLVDDESSFFACSAASLRRWSAILSLETSTPVAPNFSLTARLTRTLVKIMSATVKRMNAHRPMKP